MKFLIHNDNTDEETVRLKLVCEVNRVSVIAVDKFGNHIRQGHLISFDEEGTVYRHVCINTDIAVKRDSDGRVKIKGE